MQLNTDQANALNDLLKRNYDAARGYSEAANLTSDNPLRRWLFHCAKMHRGFIDELEMTLLSNGAVPKPGGAFLGQLHRAWLHIVTTVSAKSRQSILEECKRGAKLAVDDYDQILDKAMFPPGIHREIRGQRESIKDEIDSIINMLPPTPIEE